SDSELQQFASYCHGNGQKAGIYWAPFVYWGTAAQGSNSLMTGSGTYKWSNAYLRTDAGDVQTLDNGIALDPTHPGFKQKAAYYLNYFKTRGFDFLKLDFLSHGALEGVHFDPGATTGIRAYNQGMQYLLTQNNGRMFLSEAISPIFPYQYAHARRIYCDAATSIGDTAATMQAVSYGWWINGRLYQYSDPDMMKFSGGTANENQSRLINAAVAGTLFLNSDDLASAGGQNLARTCLTNANINEVARAGASFRPVEGNTGTNAAEVFVRPDGNTWYVAVFNYSALPASRSLNLARLGISGTFTAMDLWSGALSGVSGTTWTVNLGARQAKLFRLGAGPTTATGPTNQPLVVGSSTTLSTTASGTPPFSYVWRKNGAALAGQNANSITLNPVGLSDAGTYSVQVSGGAGSITNSALLVLLSPTRLTVATSGGNLNVTWPAGYTGWRLQAQTGSLGANWSDVPGSATTNTWSGPINPAAPATFYRLVYPSP
ncbi:MAG TPA: immunoglobulin domain-containing protein, partial [Methylomirabilota bacterium]|nr:immunoglobulin domain-containing protein [Methylomirabilota bacterium]